MGRSLDAMSPRLAMSRVFALRVNSLQQAKCAHYSPFAPKLSAVPFADAVSRKLLKTYCCYSDPHLWQQHTLPFAAMPRHLLTLRLEDCASNHLKLAASRCSLSYAASYCILPAFPKILQDILNSSYCNACATTAPAAFRGVTYRCSNWGERNMSTTHCASATIGPPSATTATN